MNKQQCPPAEGKGSSTGRPGGGVDGGSTNRQGKGAAAMPSPMSTPSIYPVINNNNTPIMIRCTFSHNAQQNNENTLLHAGY